MNGINMWVFTRLEIMEENRNVYEYLRISRHICIQFYYRNFKKINKISGNNNILYYFLYNTNYILMRLIKNRWNSGRKSQHIIYFYSKLFKFNCILQKQNKHIWRQYFFLLFLYIELMIFINGNKQYIDMTNKIFCLIKKV